MGKDRAYGEQSVRPARHAIGTGVTSTSVMLERHDSYPHANGLALALRKSVSSSSAYTVGAIAPE
ncbi:hypothetical protein ACFQ15_14960 [Sphingomonas hankookensis]|uniref:hypothetical protein n=1 Tax=Sphingomonas hankookensis TaxID=563996 RepID=UPI001F59F7C0|nr:hypothetical protein [Sphingomonas hankookensis]